MAIIGLQKGPGKWSKVRKKLGNFEMNTVNSEIFVRV